MKVLITGGSGYIGSHLSYYLKELGHTVTTIDLKDGFDLKVKRDITSIFEFNDGFDSVVHLAAKISVPESEISPVDYYNNNTLTMVPLLEVMAEFGCKHIIFSSTAAVYNPTETPLVENSRTNPESIYGHTKLVAENILSRLAIKLGINYVIFRFFNVAGTNEHVRLPDEHPHIIPVIARKHRNDDHLVIYGNDYPTPDKTCVRDYIHVDDICSAISKGLDKLSEDSSYNNTINLGTGRGYSVLDIVRAFNGCVDVNNPLVYEYSDRRPGDPPYLVANYDKAIKDLNWSPTRSLRDIISSHIMYKDYS